MTTAAVFGSTGAVGSQILATLLASESFPFVKTVSRRVPDVQSPKLEAVQESDTSKWGDMINTLSPKPSVVFNAVGTTRVAAGGIQNQWKIDHDLCIENARAAKAAGVKTYVFISSAGTRSFFSSRVPYSQMKIGVEDAIQELGFEHAIILRPGMILGRDVPKAAFFESIVGNINKLGQGIQDRLGKSPVGFFSPFLDGILQCHRRVFLIAQSCRSRSDCHWQSCGGSGPAGRGGQSPVGFLDP